MAENFLTQMMALEALRPSVSDELLNDDGRYFRDTCSDLTQCTHGETGNYRNRADGKAIALLWNLWISGKIAAPAETANTLDRTLSDQVFYPFIAMSREAQHALAVRLNTFHEELGHSQSLRWRLTADGSAPTTTGSTSGDQP